MWFLEQRISFCSILVQCLAKWDLCPRWKLWNAIILSSNNSLWYYDTAENTECETLVSSGAWQLDCESCPSCLLTQNCYPWTAFGEAVKCLPEPIQHLTGSARSMPCALAPLQPCIPPVPPHMAALTYPEAKVTSGLTLRKQDQQTSRACDLYGFIQYGLRYTGICLIGRIMHQDIISFYSGMSCSSPAFLEWT